MIEEQAVVVAVEGDFAVVEAERKTACGHCSASSACGTSMLDKFFSGRASRMRVSRGGLELVQGQTVVVGIDESGMLRAAFVVYMLPILSMFLFVLIGGTIMDGKEYSELLVVFMAITGLVAGFMAVRLYSGAAVRQRLFQAVILRQQPVSPFAMTTTKVSVERN